MKANFLAFAILLVTFVPLMVITQTLSSAATLAPDVDGKEIFLSSKCSMCHSVSSAAIEAKVKSEKMRGPDLAGVMTRHTADWVSQFLKKEKQLNGKPHKIGFKGSDEELAALISWLEKQK